MPFHLPLAAMLGAILVPVVLSGCVGPGGALNGNPDLRVVEGHFEVVRPFATSLRDQALVGRTIVDQGQRLVIDAVRPDPEDRGVTLYRLSRLDGGRRPALLCPAAAGGYAFPMAGRWTATGRHLRAPGQFTLVCLGSAAARCVRLGYRPWATADGVSLWDYNEACVRALRADYCGSGIAHSNPRDPLVIYDRLGVRRLGGAGGMSFEAAWGSDGAICVNHTRAPGRMTLRDLRIECANLPQSRLGDACDERDPGLVYSKSPAN
jgi:ADYC domain